MREVLWQLFRNGPTWDGNIIDKSKRDELVSIGWVCRAGGYNSLTEQGFKECVFGCQFGDKKEK